MEIFNRIGITNEKIESTIDRVKVLPIATDKRITEKTDV